MIAGRTTTAGGGRGSRQPGAPIGRDVDAVIFDLGNVICAFDVAHMFRRWSKTLGIPFKRVRDAIRFGPDVIDFETGRITADEYRAIASRALGVELSVADFEDGWNAIFEGVVPGMDTLIAEVAATCRTVVLSNTNHTHAEYWRKTFADVLSPVERVFCSQEIGSRKPEPDAYQTVIDYLGLPPWRVAYFDDMAEFVEGGRRVGLRGYRVTTSAEVRTALGRLGILRAGGNSGSR